MRGVNLTEAGGTLLSPYLNFTRTAGSSSRSCGSVGHVVEVVLKAGPSRKDVQLEEEEDHVLHPEATSIEKEKEWPNMRMWFQKDTVWV